MILPLKANHLPFCFSKNLGLILSQGFCTCCSPSSQTLPHISLHLIQLSPPVSTPWPLPLDSILAERPRSNWPCPLKWPPLEFGGRMDAYICITESLFYPLKLHNTVHWLESNIKLKVKKIKWPPQSVLVHLSIFLHHIYLYLTYGYLVNWSLLSFSTRM